MGCTSTSYLVKTAGAQEIDDYPPRAVPDRSNYYLEDAQIKAVKLLFASLDKNQEGKVTPEQAVAALQQFGITTSTDIVQKLILLVDDNNDGFIQEDEFLRLYICMLLSRKDSQDQMMLYVAADQNMDGRVQFHELQICCEKMGYKSYLGEEKFSQMLSQYVDRTCTQQEYFKVLEAMRQCAQEPE